MPNFKIIISIVILTASLFLLFNKLFTPQPIQITLQSGQEITTATSEYFTLAEVLLLIISAFLIGAASVFLFYNSDRPKKTAAEYGQGSVVYDLILPLLKTDEKHVISALREAGGEMQQNKLVVHLNVSKVKATRILYRLQQKGLITKERHGLTNMVKLKRK